MNRIEIKSSGDVEVTLNGVHIGSMGIDYAKPDRITITLTEREAELVHALTGQCSGGHTAAIFWELHEAGINSAHAFGFSGFRPQRWPKGAHVRAGYAHAERVPCLHTSDQVRLTMDRDVAVTLYALLSRLESYGELLPFADRLQKVTYTDRHRYGADRFTGTIKWKKRRLGLLELEVGKVYRMVKRGQGPVYSEWEEVE